MRLPHYSGLAFALLMACGSSKSDDPAKSAPPATTSPATGAPANKRTPRGAAAYPKEAITDTEGMSAAADAALVSDEGNAVQLSSLWADHNVALVFYRGHW